MNMTDNLLQFEEGKRDRARWIKLMEPYNEDAILIVRHKTKQKWGLIWKPGTVREIENKKTFSGTVVKTSTLYKKLFKPEGERDPSEMIKEGDYILFSEYAPYLTHPHLQDIQIVHAKDVIARLKEMPDYVEE